MQLSHPFVNLGLLITMLHQEVVFVLLSTLDLHFIFIHSANLSLSCDSNGSFEVLETFITVVFENARAPKDEVSCFGTDFVTLVEYASKQN